MKPSPARPKYGYERVISVLGLILVAAMVSTGLFLACGAIAIVVAMGHYGSNK